MLENPALQQVVELQAARDGSALTALLRSGDAQVRARAAFALASVQDPEAGSALTSLLSDPEEGVRRDAAFALGQLLDPLYGPALLGSLRDEEAPGVRLRLLEAIGKVGDLRTLEALLEEDVRPEEEAARNLAVSKMGLRGFTQPTSISHLVKALNAEALDVRRNAAYYFGRNDNPSPWAASANSIRAVLDTLPPSDPTAMHLLMGLALLGDLGDNQRLVTWLRGSPDWRIRTSAAVGTTGRSGDPRIRESLMDALDEPSTHVATSAADVLTRVQQLPSSEQEALKDWVERNPRDWRRAGPILATLGRVGEGEFIRGWLANWSDEDVIPRTRGIGALAFVPTPDATMDLMELASSSRPQIRGTALGGLARRWRVERRAPEMVAPYFQAFKAGLETGDPSAVFIAAPALADSAFLPLGSMELLVSEYGKLSPPDDLESMQAIERAISAITGEEEEGNDPGPVTEQETEEDAQARRLDWEALAGLGPRPRLILETEKGTVTLVLDTESAPLTVQTIAGFAIDGLYDGTPFHRVVPNFVIQGGDFARRDGFGGPGFSIRSEFTQIPYRRGVLGMASSGKDTEGSQFFIMHSMAPHLDGGYTSFGWVESGMDVVDRLYAEDQILSARVEPDRS
ncbi:MAG: peptidylprolyl isomerase [Gemmatimonadetes bacterium]|nr:peptidylprolyl isomerase [Gemmatimonadota bacterium]NNM06301.1 peptidylprolyl isomerase [Gemmatimonadota bacterium]